MPAASLLTGSKRGAAYAALDGSIMRRPAVGPPGQLERPDLHVGPGGCLTLNEAHGSGPLLNVICIK